MKFCAISDIYSPEIERGKLYLKQYNPEHRTFKKSEYILIALIPRADLLYTIVAICGTLRVKDIATIDSPASLAKILVKQAKFNVPSEQLFIKIN
jgi:hypothetical protein